MAFPSSPANGATYTTPNGTTYTYNQAKNAWYVTGGSGGSSVPSATQQYQILQADASLNWQPSNTIFSGNY